MQQVYSLERLFDALEPVRDVRIDVEVATLHALDELGDLVTALEAAKGRALRVNGAHEARMRAETLRSERAT